MGFIPSWFKAIIYKLKGSADFHFKQFSIKQERSTHKVGTDAVLLGSWVKVTTAQRLLDIGTGTGVIALMLAQRTSAEIIIDAVEIEKDDAEQAKENVSQSPWPKKIQIHHSSIQNFSSPDKYDLIVTNPPYFENSWLPPEKKRSQARHTHHLSFDELLESAKRLLKDDGRLALILPHQEAVDFIQRAHFVQLYCMRQMTFRSRINKPVERLLLELGPIPGQLIKEEMILHEESNGWSEAYRLLTNDFYLNI